MKQHKEPLQINRNGKKLASFLRILPHIDRIPPNLFPLLAKRLSVEEEYLKIICNRYEEIRNKNN